jgi:uncharacterized BrkB/YihY/UPF0761 family membrane protein
MIAGRVGYDVALSTGQTTMLTITKIEHFTMERGTEREEQALREAWAAIEERKRQTSALLLGVFLTVAGFMIMALVLALPSQLCIHHAGLTDPGCTIQNISPGFVLITTIAGIVMIGGGGYVLWKNA